MTLIIAMTFLIGFSAQGAFAGFSPVIYDEPLDGNIVNAVFSTTQVADDFVIDTETTITDFHVLLAENANGFDGNVQYAIYEDDNGLPGDPIQDGSGTAQDGMTGDSVPCIFSNCFDFWANLEPSVTLEPGTYWIGFSGVSDQWGVAQDDVFLLESARADFGTGFVILGVGLTFSITGEVDLPEPEVFEKTLKDEGDCFTQGNEILVKQGVTQTCHFQIEYVGEEAVITDVIPAEWTVTGIMDDIDNKQCSFLLKGKSGKSATGIDCGAQTDITIMVWLETRPSPGKGHKEGTVFKPTTCDPEFVVNDGAIATSVEVDINGIPVFVIQSNDLIINAEDLNDLDCDGIENDNEALGCIENPNPLCGADA